MTTGWVAFLRRLGVGKFKRAGVKARLLSLGLILALPNAASAQTQPPNSDWRGKFFFGDPVSLFDPQVKIVLPLLQQHRDLTWPARVYLRPCPAAPDAARLCIQNQRRFFIDVIGAYYGDYNSQKNIAYDLSDQTALNRLGLSSNVIYSCSWAAVALLMNHQPTDLYTFDTYCRHLSDADESSALFYATDVLLPSIRAHMSKGTIPFGIIDDFPG